MSSKFKAAVCLLVIAVGLAALSMPVWATPSVSGGVQSTTAILNQIINSTPGINTVTTTGTGVTVRASGSVAVNAGRGLSIPVAETAEAAITAGRLAGMAARAIRYGGYVGIASVVIPWVYENSGYVVCPAPDFFCKKSTKGVDPTDGSGYGMSSPYRYGQYLTAGTVQGVCDKATAQQDNDSKNAEGPLVPITPSRNSGNGGVADCASSKNNAIVKGSVYYSPANCPAGSNPVKDAYGHISCVIDGPLVAVSEGELAGAVEGGVTGNPGRVGQLYDAETNGGVALLDTADPVTVTAPQVSAPPVTQTSTTTNPDGSTNTVKTTTQTDIKPAVNGSTMGNTSITYPSTTTTTTTTTNNTTNVTTTTTSITNNYGTPATKTDNAPDRAPPVVPPQYMPSTGNSNVTIPNDYNREATQQQILKDLDKLVTGDGMSINGKPPTGDEQLDAIDGQNKKGMAAVDSITADGVGLKGWFPSLPTAECRNPEVPNPITGAMVGVPICDKVSVFQTFISGIVCIMAMFGSVREVQAALKA